MHLIEVIDDVISSMPKRKLVEIDEEKITVIGDLHADYDALRKILREIEGHAVFLGDYADRGDYPVEVYRDVFGLFLDGKATLLRGNHESTQVYPHDLPYKLEMRMGEDGRGVYEALNDLWEKMPVSAVASDIWLVHGGVPTKKCRVDYEGIELSEIKNPDAETALEMMWNDPWEMEQCGENYHRGVFYFFGKRATNYLLDALGVRVVIRSHEPYKVLKVEQGGMVVTVGSCAQPYGLSEFAVLKIDFGVGFRDGFDLARKFGVVFSAF